ncbi:MAG: NAD-dependent epimerase/dehydratase family protein [Saprospiraceae bacterium]|nr:NAD-dependent epimerase/dehydratase family protein [Saprospiraceae bacterium]
MKHILILGSEGFIGNHLIGYFRTEGYTVSGCDLFDTPRRRNYQYYKVSRLSPEWEELFSGSSFNFCINAAGSGNVPYSMSHPVQDFEANTFDTVRILDVLRRINRDCRYLHISSAAVYGNPDRLPVPEAFPTTPVSAYGWHKLMAEQVCKEYQDLFGVSISVVRPFSVYGEGLKKQLFWDICSKLEVSDTIQLLGTGFESRDFIHISDLTALIEVILLCSAFQGEVFNAASGIETTIQDIAKIFENYYGGEKSIHFSKEVRNGDPLNWRADISKIKSLGFRPSIRLEEGVKQYIQWFQQLK